MNPIFNLGEFETFERLSKDDALDRVRSLVKKFDEHYTEFKNDNYKELQVRSDFIDELFIALGWDIKDLDEKGQPYRDVILEYGIQGKARHYSSDFGNPGNVNKKLKIIQIQN